MPIPIKMTRAHQVTLPKRLLERAGWMGYEFFVADLENDRLFLTPLTLKNHVPLASLSGLRRHFSKLGITQGDVQDAIQWARRQKRSVPKKRPAK